MVNLNQDGDAWLRLRMYTYKHSVYKVERRGRKYIERRTSETDYWARTSHFTGRRQSDPKNRLLCSYVTSLK